MPAKSHRKNTNKSKLLPDTLKLVNGAPMHHWGFVSPIRALPVPPPTCKNWCPGPDRPRVLLFNNVRAVPKDPKIPQKSFRAVGICFWNSCKCELGLGVGCGRPPLEKRRSNDAGWAALTSAPWLKPGPWPAASTRWRCSMFGPKSEA